MTSPIKIGFDAHVLDGRFQGSRTVIQRLARAIATENSDISVTLYCDRAPGLGDRVHHRRMVEQSALKRLLVALPGFAKSDALDAMIYQYICAPWSKNSWVFIHDVLPITHSGYFGLKFTVRSALLFVLSMITSRRVAVVSQYTRDSVLKLFPFLAKKVVLVRNGPSFEEDVYFSEHDRPVAGLPPGRKYVLCVGRLEKRKNVHLLMEAYRKAGLEDVRLVVVGKVEEDFAIEGLNAPGVVHLERVEDDALPVLYSQASLFVYPSAAEGFGLPLLDAVLFGAPTFSSDRTAMREVGGDLAEYFDPTAPGAVDVLAERLAGHFSDRPVRKPSLDQRRKHAAEFSWMRSANVLADAIREDRR